MEKVQNNLKNLIGKAQKEKEKRRRNGEHR